MISLNHKYMAKHIKIKPSNSKGKNVETLCNQKSNPTKNDDPAIDANMGQGLRLTR